ncbi:amidase [soil metagenome]
MESFDGIIDRLDIWPTTAGPLSGLKFAVKDMFDLEGRTCSFGTPDWKRTHSPAVKNAPSVQQLLDAGAHLKFNACADELACSLDGINVHYGTPINAQAPDRIPGGSSSGSASLVSRGEVDFALGTDTAGSVRVPASYCGIFGFRPSHDYISIEGVCPLGASFDTVGVFAGSSDLLEIASDVLLRQDQSYLAADATPTNLIIPERFASVLDPLIAPYMMAFVGALKKRFSTVKEQDFYKHARDVYDVFSIVRAREAWSAHQEWLETVKPNLATSIRQRIYSCRDISDDAFQRGSAARADLLNRSDEVVDSNSFICLPTTWGFPPLKSASEAELQDNRNRNIVITTLASCYGFPQVTIPISIGRMKLGISLMGAKGSDKALLRFVKELTGTEPALNN